MRSFANIALGIVAGSAVCYLVIHRRAFAALLKGEPLPEPPAWHKKVHPYFKGQEGE